MASRGDWLLVQELLDRGDPEFVDRLREFSDADILRPFAERWYSNPSPAARRLLLAYLESPLNAPRHEPLIKRLFKRAEAANDDSAMARFLVAFDRSLRRVERQRRHRQAQWVDTRVEAEKLVALWKSQGYDFTNISESLIRRSAGRYYVFAMTTWTEPFLTVPAGTTMPKHDRPLRRKAERFRLFSVPTRHYMRRRAWRYFRRMGKTQPERYVAAISEALVLYQDADVATGLALLDNWGLVHALFHHSPALEARPRGWRPAEGHSLGELEPAPIYPHLWRSSPRAIFDLLRHGRCRPVRQWAVKMIKTIDMASIRASIGLDEIFGLLGHDDSEIAIWAVELLGATAELAAIGTARWLSLVETAGPAALERLTELMARHVDPEQLSLADAVRMAASRPLPLARLGLSWLKTKMPQSDVDLWSLFALLEAEAQSLRAEILGWLRAALSASSEFRWEWVLEFLDSRHADARGMGLSWFRTEPRARDEVTLWQRLLESPHDDVRLALVADLEKRLAGASGPLDPARSLDPERLRLLWASVLLNVRRGGRAKPGVIGQVALQLERRPEEAEQLLPLLGVALRSVRAPERKAALAALVRMVERRPDAKRLVQTALPELQWA
jgi:hypothetical protein